MPLHGYLLAVAAAVLWGLLYVLDERLLAAMSIYRLYFLHSVAGVAVAGVMLLARGEPAASLLRISWPGVPPALVLTTMAVVGLACLAIFASIQTLGASRAAVLEISYPLFVAAFAWLLYGQPVRWPIVVGGIFIFVGSAIIVTWAHDEPPPTSAPRSGPDGPGADEGASPSGVQSGRAFTSGDARRPA